MSEVFEHGHALIIGIGADLPNTVDDAVGLTVILKDSARCAYPSEQVHLLTGEEATRRAVLLALEALAQATNHQSTAIVYFSGHGYQVTSPTGEFYYLMPYGYDVNRLYQTAISGAEFTARLQAIPAQRLLVLLDCCHAGGIRESKSPEFHMVKAPLPPEARSLLVEGEGLVLIASSQANELSFAGKPYSAFTLGLIEALSGVGVATQDGYVRVADLALHAREVVPRRTKGRQHPVLHFEQADNFVLAYYAGGDPQPKDLPFAGEIEIESEPGAWAGINQRGQTVHGPQTNIAGSVRGPVLSGNFGGSVTVGDVEAVELHGAQGVIYKPCGPVAQYFAEQITVATGKTTLPIPTAPPPPPHFVDREIELRKLVTCLTADESAAIIALQGMGGIGKTALAQKLALDLTPRFPGGVLWATLGHEPDMYSIIDRWALLAGGDLRDYVDLAGRADALRSFLAPLGKMLAVLDDVWEYEGADLLAHRALHGGTVIVVTTRNANLAKRLRCRVVQLDTLSDPDALELLASLLGPLEPHEAAARDVAKMVGYLPLGLELVAGMCDRPDDLEEMAQKLKTQSSLDLLESGESKRRQESIEACLELSYRSLPPEMQWRFRALGAFAVAPFDTSAIAAVWSEQADDVVDALRFLARRALLKRGEDGQYTQHMLLRAYALALLEREEELKTVKVRHAAHYLAVAKVGDWQATEDAFEQIRQGWDTVKVLNVQPMLLDYLWTLLDFLNWRGRWAELITWMEYALHQVQQVGDRASEGVLLSRLGRIRWMKGEWSKALDHLKRSLPILQEVGDREREGTVLNDIGVVHRSQGQWEHALGCFEDSLVARREVGDQTGEGFTLHNIGLTYQKQGYWAKSVEHLKRSLDIFEAIGDKEGQSLALNNLGRACFMEGKYHQAQECYQRSLACAQEIGDQVGESRALNNLGSILLIFGQFEQALASCKHGLSITRDVGDRVEEGIALNIEGHIHYASGQYDQAFESFKESLDITRDIGDLSGESAVLNNLALVCGRREQYDLALDHLQCSLAITQELGDRGGEGITLHNLGGIYERVGDAEKAQAKLARAMTILQELGTVCPDGMREWFH